MRFKKIVSTCLTVAVVITSTIITNTMFTKAATTKSNNTKIEYEVYAKGEYSNWEGVSNVAQFKDNEGNYCFAYNQEKNVVIVKTNKGKVKSKIKIKREHSLFGSVTCDAQGNFYIVTGESNEGKDTSKDTIFISKYDREGKLIKTVGDNGSSSLGYWYDPSFYTKSPFNGGNCDVEINGSILAVNYARHMYSGHQSNSVWAINIDTMDTINLGNIYSSHSFGQRIATYGDGFVFASEGDCYERAFTISLTNSNSLVNEGDIFHFWVRKGAFDDYNMYDINNNFAHMGDLETVGNGNVAFVGSSVKSLSDKAKKETENIFIQIFNPTKSLNSQDAYVTSGCRSGIAGRNGDESVKDYGVKWLTSGSKSTYRYPQMTCDNKGNIIVLFEKYTKYKYNGVYYMVLDSNGNITTKAKLFSKTATLNGYETPICIGDTVYWTANKYNDDKSNMYIYRLTY